MKVTANWVKQKLPFLSSLLDEAEVAGRKKISLILNFTPVDIHPPGFDGEVRFTSGGTFQENFSHFAGSNESLQCNPAELMDSSPVNGCTLNQGRFYAVFDL